MRYRYRIEPTPAQQAMLARVFGCCRVVFNDALRVRGEAYRAGIEVVGHRDSAPGDHRGQGD